VPERPSFKSLREAIQTCRACELWAHATQPVLGTGRRAARLMLVGEQPGDRDEIEGLPFVGPAGGVLDRALILRSRTDAQRHAALDELVADLTRIAAWLAER
jgi:uracil-DNA glycosylase